MKITKRQLQRIIREDGMRPSGYVSQIPPDVSLENAEYEQGYNDALAGLPPDLEWEGRSYSDRRDIEAYEMGYESGQEEIANEGLVRITKRQLRRIIKEEIQKFQLKEYDTGSPPPSWYEPDYGEEDERPTADVNEIVKYFISGVIGKTDTSEFMEKIAQKIHDNDESWGGGYHEDFVNDPRVQEAMQKDPDVQGEIAAGGSIEDLLSMESFDFHYELADEHERDYLRSQEFDQR